MSVNMRALRQKLLAKGFTARPTPKYVPTLTRQQYRDCLSMAVEQIQRRLDEWWSTQPRDEYHRAELDARADFLRQEQAEKEVELDATGPAPEPGWPLDGCSF